MSATMPVPGEHGGDGPAVAAALGIDVADLLDLSQSLNPFAPDPRPIVARHVDAVGRYPDPRRATDALAAAMGVGTDHLLLTNGGAEAIALVAAELQVGRVDEPDFALYRRHLQPDPDGPRFRSNPHNPTGLLAGADERAAVWDEAFYPLATGSWTRGDAGSLVVGSLTKLLACPGLRLGYVLAPTADALEPIARRQPAWAVNGLAAGALPDLLATVDLAAWSARIAEARADLVAVLAERGLPARPSDSPWVLVDLDRSASSLRAELAAHGVLVRDCSSFGMPATVRIAVPAPVDLGRLAGALDQVLPSTARPTTARPSTARPSAASRSTAPPPTTHRPSVERAP
ncbi:MAG: aminotransferase class I/II-fold pyridoxal phosphate-dependent enzyme [Acidimicrobiales bacterium]